MSSTDLMQKFIEDRRKEANSVVGEKREYMLQEAAGLEAALVSHKTGTAILCDKAHSAYRQGFDFGTNLLMWG